MSLLNDIQGPPLIRALMDAKKVTNTQIAKVTGVTTIYVSLVVNNHRKGYRIRKAIAKAVGVAEEVLWPGQRAA